MDGALSWIWQERLEPSAYVQNVKGFRAGKLVFWFALRSQNPSRSGDRQERVTRVEGSLVAGLISRMFWEAATGGEGSADRVRRREKERERKRERERMCSVFLP